MLSNFHTVMPQKPTRLPVDYDHLSMDPQKPGDGIAAGWFVDLELRDNGSTLWGLVDWTPTAADAISKKEYQYVSPSFARNYTAKDGKKIGTTLLAAAITNHPFLEGMAPLTLCADGDLAIVLTDRGERSMPEDAIVTAGKSYKMKDVQGNTVEVPEDEMAECSYVKSLMAKLPKEGEKVVKMNEVVDANEIVSLREKVTTLSTDLNTEREARKADREEIRLDKAKGRIESLVKDGKALPAEKEFALELAKESQALFDKWAGTHTKRLLDLNREHGSGEDAGDTDDPVQHLTSLVAQEQKANATISFEKAWQLACDKNPDAYRAYTAAVAQRV
jgi:phage I-like protein